MQSWVANQQTRCERALQIPVRQITSSTALTLPVAALVMLHTPLLYTCMVLHTPFLCTCTELTLAVDVVPQGLHASRKLPLAGLYPSVTVALPF